MGLFLKRFIKKLKEKKNKQTIKDVFQVTYISLVIYIWIYIENVDNISPEFLDLNM